MASSSFASSDSIPHSSSYDVFLSFRGDDTRYGFTGHLYSALLRKGINTFIDNDLRTGDDIAQSLLKVIEESTISVIVFSENYASSKWCLDELAHIHHCNETKQQMIRPIFYKVDPSYIRHHKGSFGDALAKHDCRFKDDLEKVNRWRRALTRSANLSGWHYKEKEGEYEFKFIEKIVNEISLQLQKYTYLYVAEHPVGLDSHVRDINELLDVGGNNRHIVGIWGTPGIGKTTIAKAVYNSIAHRFEDLCFLENVGEKSQSPEGLVQLLETLLFEILRGTNWKLSSVDKGINVIKQRLSNKRVLLILDDVNKLDWLSKLAGATGLFGEGSRVILTTKRKDLLTRHGIKLLYEVKKLDHQQALELFSWHAFRNNKPADEYVALSNRAVDYVQCLPLALKVFGSHLRTLASIDRWQQTLDSYQSAPYKEIQKPFRISYDALEPEVKEVFLDIACFFNHKEKEFVLEILKDDDLDFPENYIDVLVQSALISFDLIRRISMHNLLEQMGKDIARQESLEPGECKRLWFPKDVLRVLTESSGTHKILGIMVKLPQPAEIPLNAKSFSGMRNLKYFINCNACLSGYVDYLPNSLKLIDWGGCELQSLPSNFQPKELIMLNMPHGRITQLGEGLIKHLTKLTSLNFDECKFLKKVPDLSGISNLKSLRLSYCTSLVEVDPNVGFLEKLILLALIGCSNLTKFPTRVCWKSMTEIYLTGCKRLKKFPEIVDKMESLRAMYLEDSGIKELPSSIRHLPRLSLLYLDECANLESLPGSIYELHHLRQLRLSSCPKLVTLPSKVNSGVSSSEEPIPLALATNPLISNDSCGSSTFPMLFDLFFGGCNSLLHNNFLNGLHCESTLSRLDLSNSNFVSLPFDMSKCVHMFSLNLSGCKRLRTILKLPPSILVIEVVDCISLEVFSLLSEILEQNDRQKMDLFNCRTVQKMNLFNCLKLRDSLGFDEEAMGNVLLNEYIVEVAFPGNRVPKWFNCRKDVCVIADATKPICELIVEIPQNFALHGGGLVICIAYQTTEDFNGCDHIAFRIEINGHDLDAYPSHHEIRSGEVVSPSHNVWLEYFPLYRRLDKIPSSTPSICRIIFYHKFGTGVICKSCGVHLSGMSQKPKRRRRRRR